MTTIQSPNASLLSPTHRGGIIGGKGYNFQDAFIVSRIPEWLAEPSFVCLLKEGLEDVEVRFEGGGGTRRLAFQIKDHLVKVSNCREVIVGFFEKDQATPDTFSGFILACRGLADNAKSFRQSLERLRDARPMYEPTHRVLQETELSVKESAGKLGLTVNLKFLEDKVSFDTELGDMTSDQLLCQQFVGGIHKHFPQWVSTSWVSLAAAYQDLAHWINGSVGKACLRDDFLKRIQRALDITAPRLDKEGPLVRLYHWEDESFDLSEDWDVLLDWSELFSRSTRKVPGHIVWQTKLLPELEEAQRRIRASTSSRHIRFRPNACLSAGFAIGWAFSEVKGYSFEVKQGPEFWKSDTAPATGQWIISRETECDPSSRRLCVELNQQTDVAPRVDTFLKSSGLSCRARLSLTPDSGLGGRLDGPTALALASHAKCLIRQAVDRYGCTGIDLFYAGPLGLAIFLGRLFNAMQATIQCYEEQHDGTGYTLSCQLPT